MIRTKVAQVIDAKNRLDGVVYMCAKNREENDDAKIVTYETYMYILVNVIKPKQVEVINQNELGEDYIEFVTELWVYPELKQVGYNIVSYKFETFFTAFATINQADFKTQTDQLMINEINLVNQSICNPKEKQCNYYWYLQTSDLEVVSDTELEEIKEPYKLVV